MTGLVNYAHLIQIWLRENSLAVVAEPQYDEYRIYCQKIYLTFWIIIYLLFFTILTIFKCIRNNFETHTTG